MTPSIDWVDLSGTMGCALSGSLDAAWRLMASQRAQRFTRASLVGPAQLASGAPPMVNTSYKDERWGRCSTFSGVRTTGTGSFCADAESRRSAGQNEGCRSLKRVSILLGAAILVSSSAMAQTETHPTSPPAQDAAPQQPVTPEPEAPPLPPTTLRPDGTQPTVPQRPATTTQPTAPQPTDDGLEVPATLAPLSPDTTSVDVPPEPPTVPVPFGHLGQWVMMGSSNGLGISNETFSNSSATFFNVGGGIGIDHFVVDNVSVGFDAEASYGDDKGYGATTLTETTSTAFSGGVRFGFNVPLGELFSWYPRLTLSLESTHSNTKPVSSFNGAPLPPPWSESSVGPVTNLYAPLLLHPASHFVVGFGPRLQHDFAVARGGPYDGSQPTLLSGEFVVGGWWGGAAPDRAGRDSGVADAVGPEKAADQVFSEEGQIVLTLATDASVSYLSYSRSKGSNSNVNLEPSVDYFVTDGVSIGIDAFIGYSSGTSVDSLGTATQLSSTNIGVAPRVGGNLPLTELVSIWLRGEIGYGTVNQSEASAEGTNQHSRKRAWINISSPFLLHPSAHFFVGAGPFLFHELSDKDQYSFENNATSLGVSLVLGGWFAASGAHVK